MSSATISKAPAHVPAWRRLGLKLKSAQESPSIDSLADESAKRKRNPAEESTPSKKLKKNSQFPPDSAQEPTTPLLVRKKSVTFTPETKVDDGDSIKALFNSWKTEQQAQDPSFDFSNSNPAFQTPEPSRVEEQVDINLEEKERRLKRVKKPVEEKASKQKPKKPSKVVKPPVPSSRPFLQYLRQYCESRDTWKFNKNHQNHLLKHAFNIEVVPSDHVHFLYEYVKGLQGGVRTRLRDTALEFKVKDQEAGAAGFPDTMGQLEKRQREYEAAISEYTATMTAAAAPEEMGYEEGILLGLSDTAMEGRVAKRMRTEKILTILASTPDGGGNAPNKVNGKVNGNEEAQNGPGVKDEVSQKIARKRKQRTVTVASDSDDSSSSESDDSSDDSTARNDQDDSSSSSSSSSSESDSGEEDSEDSEEGSEESDSE